MDFDRTDTQDRKYALLSPVFDQNATLKAEAKEAGVTIVFDKKEHGYRLMEDSVPKGLDVDSIFGKYATAEARAAAAAERQDFESKLKNAEKVVSSSIDPSLLFYPPRKNKEREAFDKLRDEKGVEMKYSPKEGAFVLRSGSAEGFERWQTEEMKAQWKLEGEQLKAKQTERVSEAGKAVEKVGKIADGKKFLAEHENGFMLPSKTKHPELHKGMVESLSKMKRGGKSKDVSDEDLNQVFKNTVTALRALERKKFAIELGFAQKTNPSMTAKDFGEMSDEDRRKAAGYKGMKMEDFSRLIALRNGMFALREERIARGLATSKDNAREMQEEKETAKSSSPRSNEMGSSSAKQEETQNREAPKETAQKTETKQETAKSESKKDPAKETKPALAGTMAQALMNAGINGVER